MPNAGDLTPRGLAMIREALERAFDMTLPSSTVEAIVQAIYDWQQISHDQHLGQPRPERTSSIE